ncbi:MAG: transcriptional regulator [bacterium]|nr:transcriptional regulator [bacterium]
MKHKNNKYLDEFIKTLLTIKTPSGMKDFLMGILTSSELEDITTRLQIVKMLIAKVPQRKIAQQLKVGMATVSRGSRELKQGRFKHLRQMEKTRADLRW